MGLAVGVGLAVVAGVGGLVLFAGVGSVVVAGEGSCSGVGVM